MATAQSKIETARPHLRLRDYYAFFAPLVLMVELNMISKSAIHAFLARTATPDVTLAAFNAGFTFYYAITSATEVIVALSLSYLKSRRDLWRVIGFTAVVLSVPWTVALCAVFTPLGAEIFGNWFSLSPQGQVEARWTVGILALSAPVLLMRGTAFALLMLNRKTIIITCSTFIRLASLGLSLLVLPLWPEGAAIGAAALVFCMASETVFAWFFAWPLIINGSAEMGVIFTINLYLGRLNESELAIAAFGVIHGLVSLLMGPMRNLAQTAQTLIGRREDVRVMFVFTGQLIAGFIVFALLLFQTPLRDVILRDVMGLTPELAAYCGLLWAWLLRWRHSGPAPRCSGACWPRRGRRPPWRRQAYCAWGPRRRGWSACLSGAEWRRAGFWRVGAIVRGGGLPEQLALAAAGVVCGGVAGFAFPALEKQRAGTGGRAGFKQAPAHADACPGMQNPGPIYLTSRRSISVVDVSTIQC